MPLQQRLGYAFRQPELLTRALTHRSFGQDHNERLEFLGDAVLGLAVSSLLFDGRSASSEGDLTRVGPPGARGQFASARAQAGPARCDAPV